MDAKAQNVIVIDHPLVQHKLTLMRKRDTAVVQFRQLAREIALLLAYEVTRDLPRLRLAALGRDLEAGGSDLAPRIQRRGRQRRGPRRRRCGGRG